MDINNLLEYLIPIIFLIVWVIGRIFKPKQKTPDTFTPNNNQEPFPEAFEQIFEPDVEEQAIPHKQRPISPSLSSSSFNQYPGHFRSRIKDINDLNKSFILNESRSGTSFKPLKQTSDLRTLLKGPHALKKAFLTCEILGPPLCLRKNGKISRSWQR